MTKLKIKYNPFAKAFKDTKGKTEEKDRREHQEVYSSALGYGKIDIWYECINIMMITIIF